jgi:hypothetical protein
MDLARKTELARQHLLMVARHEAADAAVRDATLAALAELIAAERRALVDRQAAAVTATLSAAGLAPAQSPGDTAP